MGKKKFIDKKKSATFRLVYKDSSAEDYQDNSDRVFTRVDGGDSYVPGFDDDNQGSRFDNAEEEEEEEEEEENRTFARALNKKVSNSSARGSAGVPQHVRRELVEMGFPDDGYNYMQHLREIGPSGLTGSFVPNNNLRLDLLQPDVKAYDASRVHVSSTEQELDTDNLLVSGSTSRIRGTATKVLDPDVFALLEMDENDIFASADELEDDFIAKANQGAECSAIKNTVSKQVVSADDASKTSEDSDAMGADGNSERPLRFLDEQFELLALREYEDDEIGELDYDESLACGSTHISEFNNVMSDFLINSCLAQDKYQTPAEIVHDIASHKADKQLSVREETDAVAPGVPNDKEESDDFKKNSLAGNDLYFESESTEEEKEVVIVSDTDEDKDHWDCETVVSTYSNLDNHPAKISCYPRNRGKGEFFAQDKGTEANKSVIQLQGKQQLPVDYLPERQWLNMVKRKEKASSEKHLMAFEEKRLHSAGRRQGETKEERKARKASIKEEKRMARAAKKELKLLYKGEAQRAQHGAAVTGPGTIHLS